MNVVYAIPTANAEQCGRTFARWRDMGYRTVALANGPAYGARIDNANHVLHVPDYPGWAASVNRLFTIVSPDILVTGGDDMLPDPNRPADAIAAEFLEHFGGTLGVMQPTGDRWMPDERGVPVSERICGSPWLGAEFCRRANRGRGPLWPGYRHWFADEELCAVTRAAGLLWQRPDLSHLHEHHLRRGAPRPAYMEATAVQWAADAELFRQRSATGFPGHELL